MPLTTARLTRMRALQDRNLPDTCAIVRAGSVTSDGRGGRTSTRSTVATIACRVAMTSPTANEPERDGRLLSANQATITVANGTDIRDGDRITSGGRTFEVLGKTGAGAWSTAVRLACMERPA